MTQFQQPYQTQQQMIKVYMAGWPRYSAVKNFQHNAAKLARIGWRVQSQSPVEKVSLGRKGYHRRLCEVSR